MSVYLSGSIHSPFCVSLSTRISIVSKSATVYIDLPFLRCESLSVGAFYPSVGLLRSRADCVISFNDFSNAAFHISFPCFDFCAIHLLAFQPRISTPSACQVSHLVHLFLHSFRLPLIHTTLGPAATSGTRRPCSRPRHLCPGSTRSSRSSSVTTGAAVEMFPANGW